MCFIILLPILRVFEGTLSYLTSQCRSGPGTQQVPNRCDRMEPAARLTVPFQLPLHSFLAEAGRVGAQQDPTRAQPHSTPPVPEKPTGGPRNLSLQAGGGVGEKLGGELHICKEPRRQPARRQTRPLVPGQELELLVGTPKLQACPLLATD